MYQLIQLTNTIPSLRNSLNRWPWRRGFLLIALSLACFAPSPTARAQLPPPAPDGGYPGNNTAEGDGALSSVQINVTTDTGLENTAIGFDALTRNTTGDGNTATGSDALASNNTGGDNTATGFEALLSNTTGTDNTATGSGALASNNIGGGNTATGFEALLSNTTGNLNTANGSQALLFNTTGGSNTANGVSALLKNGRGSGNTATGYQALFSNNNGSGNTAIGLNALNSNTFGNNNIALGSGAGQNITGSNNIDIGNQGVAAENKIIRIGNPGTQKASFIAGIFGTAVAGSQVMVNSSGQLGVATSSGRFKQVVKPMDKASEAILALKPVTFRYKKEIDPEGIPQFGLIAEEVEKVDPDLVGRDETGKVNTVRYEAVNAMLLNEFLKEHRKVQELQATVAQQQKDFQAATEQQKKDFQATAARQQKQIEALTAGLQKVSEQLELNKPAPQIVADNQ